jgi:8-oxo-dGTP diphosphatase
MMMDDKDKRYWYKYPRPAVTTDSVIFGFDGIGLNVLLIKRGIEPFKGRWAFPGGFMNMGETAEECARRELREETGVENVYMEQLQAFSRVDRDPRERVVTIAFYALVRPSDYEVIGGDDADEARWFHTNDMPELAFDHDDIFKVALERLRWKVHFEPIGFHLLDEKFTMGDLQRLYESILGERFDRRNFQKKMMSTTILNQLDERKEGTPYRAPQLYEFDEDRYEKLREEGTRLDF